MKNIFKYVFLIFFVMYFQLVFSGEIVKENPNNLPACGKPDLSKYSDVGIGGRTEKWDKCWGRIEIQSFQMEFRNYFMEDILEGEWKAGHLNGIGFHKFVVNYTARGGDSYLGQFKNGKMHGKGIYTKRDGEKLEGIWDDDEFVKEVAVNLIDLVNNEINLNLTPDVQQLNEEERAISRKKYRREQVSSNAPINLKISNTIPDENGLFVINIQANTDVASLKVNGREEGGKQDGNYVIQRIARAGQVSSYTVTVINVFGVSESKTLKVTR